MVYQSDTAGVIICIVASIISNVGVNVQKHVDDLRYEHYLTLSPRCPDYHSFALSRALVLSRYSHNADERKVAESLGAYKGKAYYLRPFWHLGNAMVIFGAIGDFVSFGIAHPAVIAATGGATCLVTNVFVGKYWNKEPADTTDFVGVAFVVGAAITLALTKSIVAKIGQYTQLVDLFEETSFIIFVIILATILFFFLATVGGSFANKLILRGVRKMLRPILVESKRLHRELGHQMDELRDRVEAIEERHRAQRREHASGEMRFRHSRGSSGGRSATTDGGGGGGGGPGPRTPSMTLLTASAKDAYDKAQPLGAAERKRRMTVAVEKARATRHASITVGAMRRTLSRRRSTVALVVNLQRLAQKKRKEVKTRLGAGSDPFIYAGTAGVIGA